MQILVNSANNEMDQPERHFKALQSRHRNNIILKYTPFRIMFAHRQLDGLLIESTLQTNHQIQGTEAHTESPVLSFL